MEEKNAFLEQLHNRYESPYCIELDSIPDSASLLTQLILSLSKHSVVFCYGHNSVEHFTRLFLGTPVEHLQPVFERFLVMDTLSAYCNGEFSLKEFFKVFFDVLCKEYCIDLPSMHELHEQEVIQVLRDEDESTILLLNTHLVPEQFVTAIRSITQEKHKSIVVYDAINEIVAEPSNKNAFVHFKGLNDYIRIGISGSWDRSLAPNEPRQMVSTQVARELEQEWQDETLRRIGASNSTNVWPILFELIPFSDRVFFVLINSDGSCRLDTVASRRPGLCKNARLSRNLLLEVFRTRDPIAILDKGIGRFGALMLAPVLCSQFKVIGVVQVDSESTSHFSKHDLMILYRATQLLRVKLHS